MHTAKVREVVFPEIGTVPRRPQMQAPASVTLLKSNLPFGPGNGPLVVKHRSALPLPFDRLKVDLETIFRLARTSEHEKVHGLLANRHKDDPLDLNKRIEGHNYQTPLFDAAYNKQLGMVKVLLKFKADPSAKDKLGRTPLHVAAINNSVPVLQALLLAKADLDHRDKFKRTALDTAAQKKNPHAVDFLRVQIEKRQREISRQAERQGHSKKTNEDIEKSILSTEYKELFTFLDPLGYAALVRPIAQLLIDQEEPLTVAALYNLEPSDVVKLCPKIVNRKQARAIWKAIPNDIVCGVQRTAAGW